MFKEFTDAASGKKLRVQYDHIFLVNELADGCAQVVSAHGAAATIKVPYAEISAWLSEVEKDFAE